jgi:hypothetical protein
MEDSLTNAFRRYAELICATLRNHRTFDGRLRETGIVMLQPDKRFEFLPWVVEQMEEDEPFRHLVMATRATFPDQHYTQNDGLASHAVKNFCNRSPGWSSYAAGCKSCSRAAEVGSREGAGWLRSAASHASST